MDWHLEHTKAKELINRCFNIGSYIATIWSTNMNPGIPQCKNCWKWGHATGVCRLQGVRYIKCNGPYKFKHHHHFAWCYKANKKTNLSKLEMKKEEPCLYFFKYSNCKGDYQADSNIYSFWQHKFNREWHSKEYLKIHKNRKQSIHSAVNSSNL